MGPCMSLSVSVLPCMSRYVPFPFSTSMYTGFFPNMLRMDHLKHFSKYYLNEPTWITDGFNELIVDFLFALVIFLDSTQPRPLKSSNKSFFFLSNIRIQ